jgi:quinol monooxygenase YgiN
MIIGTLRIPLSPDRRAEVIQILQSIQGPVSAQPGCVGCHIYEEEDPEPAVLLVERWESEATLEEHIRSEAYRRILGAIERSGSPPQVCFDFVSASEGMELIERLRGPGEREKSP